MERKRVPRLFCFLLLAKICKTRFKNGVGGYGTENEKDTALHSCHNLHKAVSFLDYTETYCLALEIIDKGGKAFQGLLAGLLNLDGELDGGLDGTAQIGQFLQLCLHAYVLSA